MLQHQTLCGECSALIVTVLQKRFCPNCSVVVFFFFFQSSYVVLTVVTKPVWSYRICQGLADIDESILSASSNLKQMGRAHPVMFDEVFKKM